MPHVENHRVEEIVTPRVGDAFLHATRPPAPTLQVEQEVRFGWNPAKVALFDRGNGVTRPGILTETRARGRIWLMFTTARRFSQPTFAGFG
jgi:hypothetical protein